MHEVEELDREVFPIDGFDMPLVRLVPVIGFLIVLSIRSKSLNLNLMPIPIKMFFIVSMRRPRTNDIINKQ
jgi:hypothetical protein